MDVLRPLRITVELETTGTGLHEKWWRVVSIVTNRTLEQVLIGRVICLYLRDIVARRVRIVTLETQQCIL
jgi:hypothetical protein